MQAFKDIRITVAQNMGTIGEDIVDIFMAVNICQKTSFGALDEGRHSPDRPKSPYRTADSSRENLFCPAIQFL
jgi:hypothetical protein